MEFTKREKEIIALSLLNQKEVYEKAQKVFERNAKNEKRNEVLGLDGEYWKKKLATLEQDVKLLDKMNETFKKELVKE